VTTTRADILKGLVDARFGPITRVVRQPRPAAAPAGFTAFSAEVVDTRAFADWQADPFAFGASLEHRNTARAAAIGEAVERYCGNAVPRELPQHSYARLRENGVSSLDPTEVVLYSDCQYSQPRFPFTRFTEDLPVRWTSGHDLVSGEPVLVPASLVYLNYHHDRYAAEPHTNFMIMPGIAAGTTVSHAVHAALAELLERDAVTTWWQRGTATTAVEPEPDGFPDTLLTNPFCPQTPTYHVFVIPSDLSVPVIGALLDDHHTGIVTMGSACHPDPRAAAIKALTEAIQLRSFSVDLTDPDSKVWRGFTTGYRPPGALVAFRSDRAYLDNHPADFSHAVDFASHAQLYLDPRMRAHLQRILEPAGHGRLPPRSPHGIVEQVIRQGYRILVVDLTTSDIAAAGMHVVRVLVPGLYPNAPAAVPFLGGSRLYRTPDGRLDETDLVRAPIPSI
jgi:ribosomal protein S12 methylthiotransferase accessory factor